MPTVKIDAPPTFSFSTIIPIRITDINYGGHVGNDTILSLLHEARVKFLERFGYNEFNVGGVALIMSNAAIQFRKELFYGNDIKVSVAAGGFTKVTFELYYKVEVATGEKHVTIATAKTGMVCYDYKNKKIVSLPQDVEAVLLG